MYPDETASGPELRDYLRILRRRRLIVIALPLLALVFALVFTQLQTRLYASSAELLFQTSPAETVLESNSAQRIDPNRRLRNEIRVLTSPPVREAVRAKLGTVPSISATPAPDTDVIRVRAVSTRPRSAAVTVNAYAEAYIEFRQQKAIDELFSAAQKIQQKLTELQRQTEAAPPGQKEELSKVQGIFREELERLRVSADLTTAGAQLVAPAEPATEPFSPQPMRNIASALAVGLVLGVAGAFLRDHLDDTVKDKDDLAEAAGLPVLGLIPVASAWKAKDPPQTVSLIKPSSLPAEAYRTLRTSVQFQALDKPLKTIQITSPSAEEGKTTTLANLGVALARAGQRVVLLCCDLRRPRIHEFFGLSNIPGFTSVLIGDASLQEALQRVPDVDRLFVLGSGPIPPNPSELLSSRRVKNLLSSLHNEGYMVLADSPPVLPVTDALVLSRLVDATLVITAAHSTRKKEIARAVELLRQVDAPLVGTVLNGVTPEGGYGYGYGSYTPRPQSPETGAQQSTNGKAKSAERKKHKVRR